MKKMQNWQENIPMTKDKFWEVINNARAIAPALEGEPLRESLYKQLLKLSPDELVGFDCAWQEYRRIANSPQLIAAACIINGGTSDDRFDYFKNWLILQGQYVFRQALKDPDTLAEFKIPFDDTEWEDCGYLTSLAFVGRALPTYFAQEGIAKELRRKYPALLQAPWSAWTPKSCVCCFIRTVSRNRHLTATCSALKCSTTSTSAGWTATISFIWNTFHAGGSGII